MKKNTKNAVELSTQSGTIAYAVVKNKTTLNAICSNRSISIIEQKRQVIEILEADSRDYPSRVRIFGIINSIRNSTDLLMYLYNLILAGDGLEVIS